MKLVPINIKDEKTLDWLYEFIKQHHYTPEELLPHRDSYLNPDTHFFKAVVNKRVVGISCYKKLSPTYVEISKTIIDPKFRDRGFGSLLSEKMVELVKERGFKKVLSIVYTTNLKMLFIRLKQGFMVEGLMRNADAPGVHEYFLGKELE